MSLNAKIRNFQSLEYADGDLAPSDETIDQAIFWVNAAKGLGLSACAEPGKLDSIAIAVSRDGKQTEIEIRQGIPHYGSGVAAKADDLMDTLLVLSGRK